MRNFARNFHTIVAARTRRPEPPSRSPDDLLVVRRSNTARRVVVVSYKPVLRGFKAVAEYTRYIRRPGILKLNRPANSRPYLRVERLLVESAAATTY
jgi:hypothetical protein